MKHRLAEKRMPLRFGLSIGALVSLAVVFSAPLQAASISINSANGQNAFSTNYIESADISASTANYIVDGQDSLFEYAAMLSVNGELAFLSDDHGQFGVAVSNSGDESRISMSIQDGTITGLLAGDLLINSTYKLHDDGSLDIEFTFSNQGTQSIVGELTQYFDLDVDGAGGDSVSLNTDRQVIQLDGAREVVFNADTAFSQSAADSFADLRTGIDNALAAGAAYPLASGIALNNQDITFAVSNAFDIGAGESTTLRYNINGEAFELPLPSSLSVFALGFAVYSLSELRRRRKSLQCVHAGTNDLEPGSRG